MNARRMTYPILAALAVLFVAVLPACDDVDPIAAAEWTLDVFANPASLSILPGETGDSTIVAVLIDENGVPQAGIGVRMSTDAGSLASNGAVQTTDARGEVRDTLTTDQDANVTATSGTVEGTVNVLVSTIGGPTAILDITPPFEAGVGTTVTYSGAASDGNITNYAFGITSSLGTTDSASGSSPTISRTYSEAQLLTVRLEVTDTNGIKDTASDIYDIVANTAPNAAVTPLSQTGSVSTTPSYTCNATVSACSSSDPDGDITAYEVSWGDGGAPEFFFGATPCTLSHEWTAASPGGYTVAVTVYDDGDGGSTECTSPASQADLIACGTRGSDSTTVSVFCPAS